jgi:uracil-DNA glycosylase
MPSSLEQIRRHQARVRRCTLCPAMAGPPVVGGAVASPVMLVGQAPGPKEIERGRPFAWTAGKTLFRWFASIGLDEDSFRAKVYMAAVCRCFPGKSPGGGDRVPSPDEVLNCARWLHKEYELLQPQLILPAGRLAIAQLMGVNRLDEVVGRRHRVAIGEFQADVIPLPHPSGASTWHKMEPGRTLLARALDAIRAHPAWRELLDSVT